MPALDGMRILDLTQYEAGTSCTQALAWLGADVVKVERPGSGDPGRAAFEDYGSAESDYFLAWNSNKRSVTIALDRPEGRALLLRLVPRFDVLVENFGPGVVEKLDLDYDAVRAMHPGIIYGRIKGFGSSGPYADYKCFDPVALAAGGAFSITGEASGPPMAPGPTLGDSGTGVQMALALCAAYVQKLRTGEGQLIEISMQEAVTYFMRTMIALGGKGGTRAAPRRASGSGGALSRLYPCAPGGPNDYVVIMAITPRMWEALCEAIERPDLHRDPRFASGALRRENQAALEAEIEAWTRRHTKAEAMRRLGEAGVPASAVLDTLDLFSDPHLVDRGFVRSVEHETMGPIRLLGWPARLSRSEVELRAAPLLGRHTDDVLHRELGVSDAEIAELRARKVIGDEGAAGERRAAK
jgi:formyl-CoA transferase